MIQAFFTDEFANGDRAHDASSVSQWLELLLPQQEHLKKQTLEVQPRRPTSGSAWGFIRDWCKIVCSSDAN